MNIFISYASEQRATAEEIALALCGEGHRVFFDRSELPEGDAYNAQIREAIRDCDLLVFLVSPEALSEGRYTLTELKFAQEKWRSPAGRLLPVVVRPVPSATIPPYLRAVVALRPAGSAAAEVVAAVSRMSRPRWARIARRAAIPLTVVVLIAAAIGTWRAVETSRSRSAALNLVEQARVHEEAGDYAAAWDRYSRGLAAYPNSREASEGQERLAMEWLENIRTTAGKESFSDIVDTVQPALSRAALSSNHRRAADALAHLGWADFLRAREGKGGLDPVRRYRQALRRDPGNPYAHAFWGHYIMASGGDAEEARAHFDKALAPAGRRPFVRELQIAALLWRGDRELENEVIRVANEVRATGEELKASNRERVTSALWNIYHSRLVRGGEKDKEVFFRTLPAKDLLGTFTWLCGNYDNDSNREPYLYILAQLLERSGDTAEALASYESLFGILKARGAEDGRMGESARQALRRLRPS